MSRPCACMCVCPDTKRKRCINRPAQRASFDPIASRRRAPTRWFPASGECLLARCANTCRRSMQHRWVVRQCESKALGQGFGCVCSLQRFGFSRLGAVLAPWTGVTSGPSISISRVLPSVLRAPPVDPVHPTTLALRFVWNFFRLLVSFARDRLPYRVVTGVTRLLDRGRDKLDCARDLH